MTRRDDRGLLCSRTRSQCRTREHGSLDHDVQQIDFDLGTAPNPDDDDAREGGEAVLRFFEVRRTEQFEHDVHGLETCDVLARTASSAPKLTQFLVVFFWCG